MDMSNEARIEMAQEMIADFESSIMALESYRRTGYVAECQGVYLGMTDDGKMTGSGIVGAICHAERRHFRTVSRLDVTKIQNGNGVAYRIVPIAPEIDKVIEGLRESIALMEKALA